MQVSLTMRAYTNAELMYLSSNPASICACNLLSNKIVEFVNNLSSRHKSGIENNNCSLIA